MIIVSWNVNSIRARLERVVAYLARQQPDVICLQETKVVDEDFPREVFVDSGYPHLLIHGQKTYNGVAIASRLPLENPLLGLPAAGEDQERRLVGARVGGLRLFNVYVPNGQEVGSSKFGYKLKWLEWLRELLRGPHGAGEAVLVAGDFNIAPEDRDVYDPDALRGTILFSEPEHQALRRLLELGLEDVFRRFTQEGGHFSWWDYRQLAFPRNRGLRIDLVLASPAAAAHCREVVIDRDERKGKGASDHAPVRFRIDPAGLGGSAGI